MLLFPVKVASDLPAIGLSVCKTLTFATEYDKIKAGRDDASGLASPLCIKSYQRGTGRQPFARWMAALLFATFPVKVASELDCGQHQSGNHDDR